jgi:hypothetical protein
LEEDVVVLAVLRLELDMEDQAAVTVMERAAVAMVPVAEAKEPVLLVLKELVREALFVLFGQATPVVFQQHV